ncbi:MAG: peptide deformylase [Chloroflexi bacterium]|nr:peptide deformylase [Chloroflexota bacterium]
MAVLSIRLSPDPVLRQKAKRVKVVSDSIRKLISDMMETVHADPGRLGLAAPQVGISLRVMVICLPEKEDIALVNPEIVRSKGEHVVTEGCLSLPGRSEEIKRAESVTVKGLDPNGKAVRIKANGLLAQAFQHEIDHLNGVLYIDHVEQVPESAVKPAESGPPGPA